MHQFTLSFLDSFSHYADRHIGMQGEQADGMARQMGFDSWQSVALEAVPQDIRTAGPLDLPAAATEEEMLAELSGLAERNKPMVQMIGQGYHSAITPPVIARNILENPAWYTAYTPYHPEISQGRLEALMNFQTMISELTGLPVANASLLDEGTAAAEAMTLLHRTVRGRQEPRFIVDTDCLPQTLALLQTRAAPLGIEVAVHDFTEGLPEAGFFAALFQYPGTSGAVRDLTQVITAVHERAAYAAVAADPLSLAILKPPGAMGADVVIGSTQRFGCPLGFGGPHAGYIAVRSEMQRSLPGRIVGASIDAGGQVAYRLALQTREQHIRREKATSNICTASVLSAILASMYAVYHGPQGLRTIAHRVHRYALVLAAGLAHAGLEVERKQFFDTVLVRVPGRAAEVVNAAEEQGINLRISGPDHVGISCSEVTERQHLVSIWSAFGIPERDVDDLDRSVRTTLPDGLFRKDSFLSQAVFQQHHTETGLTRYLRRLADKDYALDRGMIPLGSCTMKMTPTAAMLPVTWRNFADIHPFAPSHQTTGYLELIEQLKRWLAEITGYDAVSLQPNSGAQGEYAGLLAIRSYQASVGQGARDVCLMPASAHGTNAASASAAGLHVVVVACDDDGNIDMQDLRAKLHSSAGRLAVLMITYPSTHGVFEESIPEICQLAHDAGAQVYLDGANLNALVGLARPGRFGADVSHVNLHKTFGNPHGGGGPGIGPVCVRAHLAPYLPSHPSAPHAGPATGPGPVAAAPWGSAGILPISWAYLRLMGPDGLTRATQSAVFNANYIAHRLSGHYPILYTGRNGLVAHECIIDIRPLTCRTGITVTDIVKRLADYGFHAPTVSFPVPGTLMIEPTESETLAELDRFCSAMISIKEEIEKVDDGHWPRENNPLRNAPHTASSLVDEWPYPYTREEAAFPDSSLHQGKYWPTSRRLNEAHGDRNLICSCPSLPSDTPAVTDGTTPHRAIWDGALPSGLE
ncbi:aminomethyl-transferring glycine dehydrogenase [Streptomyces sp. NPDC004787]|uniref:aminomethyl-transferring glycine dehydrogenase n=1 Tax=Streptomyces sp. NPDC004787 TaxID=3154291 RepID=UPI0033B9291C